MRAYILVALLTWSSTVAAVPQGAPAADAANLLDSTPTTSASSSTTTGTTTTLSTSTTESASTPTKSPSAANDATDKISEISGGGGPNAREVHGAPDYASSQPNAPDDSSSTDNGRRDSAIGIRSPTKAVEDLAENQAKDTSNNVGTFKKESDDEAPGKGSAS